MIQNFELGISTWFGYKLSYEERIKLIKDAGFQSVMIWWGEENENKETTPQIARKYGLKIENLHFPFADINSIWENSIEGEELFNKYLLNIDDCKVHEISTAVMHVTQGGNTPQCGKLGLDRFKRLIENAEKNNVTIALENVWTPDYLDYLFNNIESDKLKFCYDSGHENCFTAGTDCLAKFCNKLVALHLHDNDGTGDQHALPFSGTVKWERITNKLRELKYKGTIALELEAQYSNAVNEYTAPAFLLEARNRAQKLVNMVSSNTKKEVPNT